MREIYERRKNQVKREGKIWERGKIPEP